MRKVLIVSSEFPPQPGGIGNHAYNLSTALAERRYHVTVLTELREEQPGEWRSFADLHKGLSLIGVPRHRISSFTYGTRLSKAFALLAKHSWHAVIFSGKFSVLMAGIFAPSRAVLVLHGSEIKQKGIQRLLFERGLRNASRIVCVSRYTQQQLISEHGTQLGVKSDVINNGIRNDWTCTKARKPFNRKYRIKLVTVGGIHRRKGHFNVVAALPRILEDFPLAEYHIAGLPTQKNELEHYIKSFGLSDKIFFHHGLNDSGIRELLEDCNVFLMLSEHLPNGDFEGFGIAIVEAMALGLPAIGTMDSGIADAIQDHISGRLVDPKNPLEIVEALSEIIENYSTYSSNALASAGKARWQHRISHYQKVIESL